MARQPSHCNFCGRHADECPSGFYAPSAGLEAAICIYCARMALAHLDTVYAATQAGNVTDLASRRAREPQRGDG
jgi:hypothetical protein